MADLTFDLLIRGAGVVVPDQDDAVNADIGITDGRIAAVGPGIDPASAAKVHDATGLLAFPGLIDAHQHWGIYGPLAEDAASESRAASQGGVTTGLTYMRTGRYYLNRGGSYLEFMPEVLESCAGRSAIDYGFHLAPMTADHIAEIPEIIDRFGVTSFKIFMFYGGFGLHGRSDDQRDFLMIGDDDRYDMSHFEFVMRGIQAARDAHPDLADDLCLSLHCETAEIMAAYTKMVEADGSLSGLAAYSAARPPHSEGLAISIASYLAHETGLPTINLLHLSSAKAIDAALRMSTAFPHVDFRREVTLGHLLLDIDSPSGSHAKVNPPIRPREDVEALWEALLAGHLDWIVSDHACCRTEQKTGGDPDDIFVAKSGFGGAEYLLAGAYSEGTRRGLSAGRLAELLSTNPARRYGLHTKGAISVGLDADIALLDPNRSQVIRATDSESTQGYTPFEGIELSASVRDVFLRGTAVVEKGNVLDVTAGQYLRRPTRP